MKLHQVPITLLLLATISGCGTVLTGDRPFENRDASPQAKPESPTRESQASSEAPAFDTSQVASGDRPSTLVDSQADEAAIPVDSETPSQAPSTADPLMPALLRLMDHHGADIQETEYQVEYIDLNNDGIDEALVLLSGQYWCGTGGCNLAIFEGTASGYELVSHLSIIHAPVWISSEITSGWRDLIVEVSGGGIEPRHVALKFNGSRYPINPSLEPEVDATLTRRSQALFRLGTFQKIPTVQS